jgi:myogenesis-regulating glycosidase
MAVYIEKLIENFNGEPLIRPIWWLEPKNQEIFSIDDQFLIGDQILAAPILDEGATSRKIYIPIGDWYEMDVNGERLNNQTITGPLWIERNNFTIKSLPYFTRSDFDMTFKKFTKF